VVTPEGIAAVETIVKENRRVTVIQIARNGDYIKKCSHFVPSVFCKLQDKKYLRFSLDSPSYLRTLEGTDYELCEDDTLVSKHVGAV